MKPVSPPQPDPPARALSARLSEDIRRAVARAGGGLDFAEFMGLALYHPEFGYYLNGLRKFGPAGDFVTAPEISPLFSHCLARQAAEVLARLGGGQILEFGAGSGIMAAEVLRELARLEQLPATYFILELSADLRARQRETLAQRAGEWLERVCWLDRLPDSPLSGVILANEVLDAMPARRFRVGGDGEIHALEVTFRDGVFAWQTGAALDGEIVDSLKSLDLPPGYVSEFNPSLPAWFRSLAACLDQGLALIVDYGFSRREYYHPQRDQGTLMCHYRHYSHPDPFFYPGLQDITTHVDFTAAAEAAEAAGLRVTGYTFQADFLLAAGLEQMLAASDPEEQTAHLKLMQQARTLIMPGEMGELFKVLALSRQLDGTNWLGFARDRRERLG